MSDGPAPPDRMTLPQLVAAVPRLLGRGYGGSTSGRIRGLPDLRTVRWYRTLGLVDAPGHHRGRTGLYGRRQLLQLAAIKQLQTRNLPLAEIQAGLAGRHDQELAALAGVTVEAADRVIGEAADGTGGTLDGRLPKRSAADSWLTSGDRRDQAFWAVQQAAESPPLPGELLEASSVGTEPAGPPTNSPLQSLQLAAECLLVWRGEPPDAATVGRLRQLAGPLVEFLGSNDDRGAADAPMKSSPGSSRPIPGGNR